MNDRTSAVLPSWHYPAAVALVFALFALMQSQGASLIASTYIPIVVAAAVVTGLELKFPHRLEWRPPSGEIRTDLAFMVAVQLALPPLVAFVFTYALVEPARALELPLSALWPHGWPIWMQALLMILTVDFLRYWLHRAAHENQMLWRLHSVHHSVVQLYWLNRARFHPFEKALLWVLDSLAVLRMSVDARVLALYYIAYSTNGFFQHSNVRVRYGFLNYIVGSAETHRWHHSRVPEESNANYGNTVIIWDLVFGTWYLPRERDIVDLGLQDPTYPKSFLNLMRAPFNR
jgi:sterol desaturase/sphingolipid hydroxylase (fatty acid hydroxylase superfamily)